MEISNKYEIVPQNIDIDAYGNRKRSLNRVVDSSFKVYKKEFITKLCIVMERLGSSMQSFIK